MVTRTKSTGKGTTRTTFFYLFPDVPLTQLFFRQDGETCPGADGKFVNLLALVLDACPLLSDRLPVVDAVLGIKGKPVPALVQGVIVLILFVSFLDYEGGELGE